MESSTSVDKNFAGFTCFWRIENFTLCEHNIDLLLKSQIFDVKMLHSKYHLECEREQNFLNVYLFKDGYSGSSILNFTITVLSSSGWLPIESTHNGTFHTGGLGYGRENILEWNTMFNFKELYLPNKSLTICCHMWNSDIKRQTAQYLLSSRMMDECQIQHSGIQKYTNLRSSFFTEISKTVEKKNRSTQTDTSTNDGTFTGKNDLLRFFAEKKFRYITLRTSSKDFAVHKALICARSPVFRAMFEKETTENERCIVDIADTDSETLALLLQFLHLEPIGNLKWEEAENLYYSSDKYKIEELKKECILQLKHKLTVQNVCKMFLMSDLHQDQELKKCAQEYFYEHSKEILLTEEWNDLLFSRTELASKILCVFAEEL